LRFFTILTIFAINIKYISFDILMSSVSPNMAKSALEPAFLEGSDLMSGGGSKNDFFGYVFNFDQNTKCELSNLAQYSFLMLIFLSSYNQIINGFVPAVDDEKGSFEITFEILLHIFALLFGIFLINRIVNFIPTYSGIKYMELNASTLIVSLIACYLISDNKLRNKINILINRVVIAWNGKMGYENEDVKRGKDGKPIRVIQPIAGSQMTQPAMYNGATPISSLPMGGSSQGQGQQPQINYDPMVRQGLDITPISTDYSEGPMAANSSIGSAFGSGFGSAFG
jgi:hypothetical protein